VRFGLHAGLPGPLDGLIADPLPLGKDCVVRRAHIHRRDADVGRGRQLIRSHQLVRVDDMKGRPCT